MKRIPLTQGLFALVDDADYDALAVHNWHAERASHTFYAARNTVVGGKKRIVRMHRVVARAGGCVYLIRTGPSDFSRLMVTARDEGGWCPYGFSFRDGRLWRAPLAHGAADLDREEALDTPQEADVFRALGYAFVPPEQRSTARPARLAVPA